jgi:SOS response regulatory protein OraA/RecX
VNDIYLYALKLLKKRDHSVRELREKIEVRFDEAPNEIIDRLIQKNFLNDRRFTENYVARRQDRGKALLREELTNRGVASDLIDEILSKTEWPSLREALADKMNGWKLGAPLQSRDATRLFRALLRLGYDEDAIREEIEQLREP